MNVLHRFLAWIALGLVVLLAAGAGAFAQSTGAGSGANLTFDHAKTGFILENSHRAVACESCHTAGSFRGTPRACSTCHAGPGARAPGKSVRHIPTGAAACENCHATVAWQPARMNHNAVSSVVCSTCHNGVYSSANSQGKPVTHIPTAATCETCHKTTAAFSPATMSHAGTAGQCNSCHNGGFVGANAQTKGPNHVATTEQCDKCHPSTVNWFANAFDHASAVPPAAGRCADCHNGARALAKTAQHIPTTRQCDACHGNTVSFTGARMDHTGTTGACSTCHSGSFTSVNALTKPLTHVSTTAQCDTCHQSTASWSGARFDHATVTPSVVGRCESCHNGASAIGKSSFANHIPTSASCDTCHSSFVSFAPGRMNHAGTAGNCATCHSGTYVTSNAQTKSVTHVATSAQCDTCHGSTTTWATVTFAHAANAVGSCDTCHRSGGSGLPKPTTHIPTTTQCDTCHTNYTSFRPATMNHAGLTNCSTCHSGGYTYVNAQAKPASHIPTTAQCSTCHNGFAAFLPASMNHAGTSGPVAAGNCLSCHNGSYVAKNAQARPVTHIPTGTQSCDNCHGTVAWKPTAFNHAGVAAGSCMTCHNGTQAVGKSATHLPTGAACDTCHANFTAFAPARMNHAGTNSPSAANNCSTCHSGAYLAINAQIKPTTHVSTTAQCDTCHRSTSSWATATFVHDPLVTAGKCMNCHNGATALGKPTTHIPTAAQCDTCHNNYTAFRPAVMSHDGTAGPTAVGNCSTCHSGTYLFANALAKPATHVQTSAQCDTCHTSGYTTWTGARFQHAANTAGACSSCHNGTTALGKPSSHIPTTGQCDSCHTNYTAFKPAKMNHVGTSAQCANCHSGSYAAVNAQAKPLTHIPTAAQCDTCHSNGFVSFMPSPMNHAGTAAPVAAGNCITCHGDSAPYLIYNAQHKSPSHVATTAQCDTCHRSTTTWATATYVHPGTAAGNCSTCHLAGGSGLPKPGTHIPTTAQCDTCHKSYAAFAPASMSHAGTTGPAASGNCSTCHGGAYVTVNALAKSANHVATSAQCDTCHSSTISWSGASYAHPATAAGTCSTCHNGTTSLGKPGTHIPTSNQCDTCHTNYTAFKPAKMNHAGTTAQCSTCHSGSYTAVNAQSKPLTHIPTSVQCDTCHSNGFVSFMPSPMNHAGTASPVAAGNCITCHGDSAPYLIYNAQHKSANHVPTTAQCDTCHRSLTTWATATYTHAATAAGTCDTCHKAGGAGLPKPSNHIPTTAQCDTCHKSYTAFAPANMDHTGTAGNCLSCHNGSYVSVNAQARSAAHIPIGAQSCDTCHGTTVWKPAVYNHTGVAAGTCANCHNGTQALGKPANHLPTSAACDVCHANFTAFAPAKMNHAGSTGPVSAGNCSTCHSGTYLSINAQVKPSTHVSTTAQCDTCHRSTTTWATATFSHDATAVGRCSTCHNGTTALGKPTTHIPSSAQCDTCHKNYTGFRPAAMNHAGTTGPTAAGNCATCHGGAYVSVNALAKPTTHIPVTGQCDTCHTLGYVAWAPARMNHTGLTTCSTCHSGGYLAQNAQIKPSTHIPTSLQCSSCHSSTTTWATGTFNHAGVVAGTCGNCHNGTNALGKPTNHVPTTAACDTCHKNYTAFAPATMTHNGTVTPAGSCANCHNGAYTAANAVGKPTTHIPTTQSCQVCHSTTAWKPTSFSHSGVTGNCASCHNGTAAAGKPVVHIPTPGGADCNACHRTGISWLPLLTPYNHSGASTTCTTCHTASYPNIDVKTANHVPTNANCSDCHTITTWTPIRLPYAHTGIANGTCQTCHTGTYAGVLGKPANHIPTTSPAGMPGNECSLCHSSKTTFSTERMNHGTMQTSCATCHDSTSPYAGTMDKIRRGSGHHNSAGKDCSSSGCHKPLGSKGTPYSKWN